MNDTSEVVILIVDDKQQNLFALERTLRNVPAKVVKATGGEQALALTLQHDVSLAILDVQMPGMDGYELAEMLLGDPSTSRIPIIFVTAAYSDEQHLFKGYQSGAVDYIVKPFDPAVLIGKVRVFLDLAKYRMGLETLIAERTLALSASEATYRTLIENAYDIIQHVRPDGTISFVSPSWERTLGYTKDQIPPDGVWALVAPEYSEDHRRTFETALSGEPALDVKASFVANGGTTVHVEGNVVPIVVDEKVVEIQGFYRDVTARYEAETRLELAMRGSGIGVWDWRIPALELDLTCGWSPIKGLPTGGSVRLNPDAWWRLIHPDDQMQRLVALDRHLSGETEYYECELRVRGVDDAWIWVMDRGKVLEWDARHQPTRMSGTLLDISARKLAEGERILRQRAEAESRAKSDFLARMSHEIRTPMNAILGYAQLLRRESGLTTRQRDYLEIIDRSGGHLLSLINQVLDLARADAGHLSLVESEFDLHVLLNDVQRMFYLAASQQGLRLTMQVSSDLPSWVLGDAGKIRQVLINLIGNALKFTEVGSITVRGWTSPVETGRIGLVFEVEDTGSGIDSTDVKTIFEAFGQTSGGARKSGAGLGLTVSRRIARQMGGDLTVTSVPGGGSVFRFEAAVLPTDDESRQRAEHRIVGLAPGQRTRRILVVDGHAESRILLERLLESVGFDVREAATGDDALSAIQAEPPDLLLLGVDGDSLDIETARRFRASCPAGLPLVVISDDVDGAAIGSESGNAFDGVLGKPLQEAELFAEIARLLGVAYAWPDSVGSTWSDSGSEDSGAAHVVLPGDLRDALCLAVESGYPDVIAARISAIVEHDPVLGRQLRGLADDFDYATLLHLINEPGGS